MLIEMRQITKQFPGVLANDQVDFDLKAGEVHALLGENGAGKSTLMSILTGLYRPDAGTIKVDGEPVEFRGPLDAIEAGIGMVHQHFKLVAPFTVAENVVLGMKGQGFFLRQKKLEDHIAQVSQKYGLQVDPAARIWQLSVGEQQRVEIFKLLYRGARVLILDEPTAVLTPQEAEDLFRTLRAMAARGHGVMIVTHKLHEVMAVADRCTVLRDGTKVGTVRTQDVSPSDLARMMLGREISRSRKKTEIAPGEPQLMVQDLWVRGNRSTPAVRGVSLSVREGEILGIAGVAGNGQPELAEAVAGLRPVDSGQIQTQGRLAYIPEDRLGTGLVPALDLMDNAIMREYRNPSVSRGPFLRQQAVQDFTGRLMIKFDVRAASLTTPVKLLSGGNQQKLLVGRELTADPKIIVASQPTRGLDVGAAEVVHRLLLQAREQGRAILMISEDLDELMNLCDQIAVMFEGRIVGTVPAIPEKMAEIGLMMAGKETGEVTTG